MKKRLGNGLSRTEILRARGRHYRFCSDLVTEQALRWAMAKHLHPLDIVSDGCHWCEIERRVLDIGHLASLKPPVTWWKRFVLEMRNEMKGMSGLKPCEWRNLRVESGDGHWWVLRTITPSVMSRRAGTGKRWKLRMRW